MTLVATLVATLYLTKTLTDGISDGISPPGGGEDSSWRGFSSVEDCTLHKWNREDDNNETTVRGSVSNLAGIIFCCILCGCIPALVSFFTTATTNPYVEVSFMGSAQVMPAHPQPILGPVHAMVPPSYNEPVVAQAVNLPPNWSAATDPNSHETYYYNTITHETSWTMPASEGQQAKS